MLARGQKGECYTPAAVRLADLARELGCRLEGDGTLEVTRAAGYLRPDDFLALFRYVRDKVYETKTFREFLKAPA